MRMVIYPPVAPEWLARISQAAPELDIINAATDGEALDAIGDAEALCGHITPELLAAGRRLRWIQATRIGLERYMFPELVESDVALTNTRGMLGDVVADHAFSLVLCLARQLHVYVRRQLERRWEKSTPLVDLPNATLGIIGLGGIGSEVAKRGAGFGMRIIAVDPRRKDKPEEVAELWPIDRLGDLLEASDFVVICAPHTPETVKMIRAEQLRRMKSTAYLINVGRGPIVDMDDLAAALQQGVIAGAGLDVFDPEPLPPDHPLWGLPNMVITPHAASGCPNNKVAERRLQMIVENVRRFVDGRPLRNLVEKDKWY